MATNQGFKSLIPNPDEADAKYLYWWLKAHRSYLESLGNGATFKEVSKAVVERVEVPLPPLPEQRRIAAILDAADVLRARRRTTITALESLTQSIFLDMFGDPASNPKGWPLLPMQSLLRQPLRNGVSPARGGGVAGAVLTLGAVTHGAFDPEAVKDALFAAQPRANQLVESEDLLICRGNGNLGLVGRGCFPSCDMPGVAFPDTIIAARTNPSRVLPEYLSLVWNSPAVRRQLESSARTTNGTYKVNQTMIEQVLIPCPPVPMQKRYSDIARSVSDERLAASTGSSRLDSLFQSLQSRAFRGEL